MSCWATLFNINSLFNNNNNNNLDIDLNKIPIGTPIGDTELYIKLNNNNNNNKLININDINSKLLIEEGELYLISNKRGCYVNNEFKTIINTNDIVNINVNTNTNNSNNYNIYLIGRKNRLIKINAKLTNLNLLEKVIYFKLIKLNRQKINKLI
jgi:hypothetical protein